VGRISRPHGVHGEVRVVPSSDNPDRFLPGSVLHARPARGGLVGGRVQQHVELTVVSIRGEESYPILAFREIADRDAAENFRGFVLEIRSSELPELEEDEYYPFDLVGLAVRDRQGAVVGQVVDVLESPAHPLLAVQTGGGVESLVPFVAAAVPEVVLSEGYLVIGDGFLEGESGPSVDSGAADEPGWTDQRPEGTPTDSEA